MDPSDITEIINKSKCLHCVHKLTRTIELVTQEDKEYYMDLIGIDNIEDYDFYIEQHKCLITDEDLDGIIHECSHFEPNSKFSLIREWRD
jgi:hypothetical protein